MKHAHLLLALLPTLCPTIARGQDATREPSEPHRMLAKFAGTWSVRIQSSSGPAQPQTTGELVERSRIVCNGLWLVTEVAGTFDGEPYFAYNLLGYDPTKRCYTTIWVDSLDPNATRGAGTFDESGGTFTYGFPMPLPDGRVDATSVTRFEGDRRSERITIDRDGELVTIMELEYARAEERAAEAAAMSRTAVTAPSETHATLAQLVGTWSAEVEMHAEGRDDVGIHGTQLDRLICGGLWVHSHFTGEVGDQPFEGFGLFGLDPETATYHSFWVDGSSPYASHSRAILTDAGNEFFFDGESRWADGTVVVDEGRTVIEGDTRTTETTCAHVESGEIAAEVRITYRRKE